MYYDLYVSGPDKVNLEKFASGFLSFIPVKYGSYGSTYVDENGITFTIPAAGDPSLFYTCIRSSTDISAEIKDPMKIVDAKVGASVVGVFE